MTGYEFAKVSGKRPQMIYNYMKNGLIKTYQENGQNLISSEEAARWIQKWSEKSLQK